MILNVSKISLIERAETLNISRQRLILFYFIPKFCKMQKFCAKWIQDRDDILDLLPIFLFLRPQRIGSSQICRSILKQKANRTRK